VALRPPPTNLEIDKMQSTATEKRVDRKRDHWEWTIQPRVDIRELDDHVVVEVELPGVATDKVDLQVEDDELRLTAPKASASNEAGSYLVRERRHGTYSRIFRLGEQVDQDAISGDMSDGVLRIRVPKQANALPRKVSIKNE
jgi:HSP20 family molecular chaperone IbpA